MTIAYWIAKAEKQHVTLSMILDTPSNDSQNNGGDITETSNEEDQKDVISNCKNYVIFLY